METLIFGALIGALVATLWHSRKHKDAQQQWREGYELGLQEGKKTHE